MRRIVDATGYICVQENLNDYLLCTTIYLCLVSRIEHRVNSE